MLFWNHCWSHSNDINIWFSFLIKHFSLMFWTQSKTHQMMKYCSGIILRYYKKKKKVLNFLLCNWLVAENWLFLTVIKMLLLLYAFKKEVYGKRENNNSWARVQTTQIRKEIVNVCWRMYIRMIVQLVLCHHYKTSLF